MEHEAVAMAAPAKKVSAESTGVGAARFRRWLVDKLKASRWPRSTNDSIVKMAKLIGVRPEVLEQAQQELDEEAKQGGRRRCQVGAPNRMRGVKRRKVEVQLPKRVYDDWISYCTLRQLPSPLVLRGLVHDLLTGPRQPTKMERKCYYRGRTYALTGYRYGTKWPYVAKTDVTEGAARALILRATASSTTTAALLRGLVLDLLEGRVQKVTVISSSSAMFDDETRYWTLEK